MGHLAQAGQMRLGWLAPGRIAPWSAWATGSHLQDEVFWGPGLHPEMPLPPLPSLVSPSGNEGHHHGRTHDPE